MKMYSTSENIIWVLAMCLIGAVIMLFATANRNTKKSRYIKKCECDWEYNGEDHLKAGAFYKCKKCGKSKYIPHKELMSMPEEEYKYWSTRPLTQEEEKLKQI